MIRFATKDDEPMIVDFLKKHWNGNPILTKSPTIFRYQYMQMCECGFVLAFDEDGNLCGLKGYIPLNHSEQPDIAAALAIVLKQGHPMLNMEMQRFLEKETNCRMMCSTGLNSNTAARIYPLFRYKVDKLAHFYKLGRRTQWRVAKINVVPQVVSHGTLAMRRLENMEALRQVFSPDQFRENMPYKDEDYIQYRYFSHPVYAYHVYGIMTGQERAGALLIGREVCCEGTKVFRIVDYIGDRALIREIGCSLDGLIEKYDYEYLDFYCYGIPDEDLEYAGFTRRTQDDQNIIPNYFEPFVQSNVEIIFFCKQHENILICKSDGDQDRPSIMPDEK